MEQKITSLFLDIGGVLLTNGWGHESQKLAAEKFGFDIDEMRTRHQLIFDAYELGKFTLDEYLDYTIFYADRNFTKTVFKKFMFSQSKELPGMIAMMHSLKKQYGLKIAVVSNEGREINNYRISNFNLTSLVDFFISSCFVHFRKPDIDIFRLALDVARVKPEEVVYIEDQPMFISMAERLNITGIRHVSPEDTRDKLALLGLKLNNEA